MDKPSREPEHGNDETKLAKKIKNFIYHPGDQIGSGFSSQVFKGVNQLQPDPSKKNIAIKVIQLSKIQNQVQNYLLNNQVNALKLLKHPNILQTVDILMTKNNVYIVTEFCEGGDLLKYIKSNGPFNEIKAMSLIKDVIEGYKCIEENNIIHRDLKTSNIFLSKGRAKIADFGFCEFLGQKKPQIAYNVGSPAYMSPQSYKQNQYSHKSDIWAIGIILYQFLIGQTPQRTSTYTEMVTNLMNGKIKNIQNEEIKRILSMCFKKNVKERIDAIGLAELVGLELNRLQGGVQQQQQQQQKYNSVELGQQNKIVGLPTSRNVSPSKTTNKQLKFFKSQIPKLPPSQPNIPTPPQTMNRIPQNISTTDITNRKSIARQRQPQIPKINQLKPHTQYLLYLYRLLKFVSELKHDKIHQVLLPLFRHRSLIQSVAQLQYQQGGQQQQQFFKQLQYLKNRFDQVYLQQLKQSTNKPNPYKQKLDTLANIPFNQPQCLVLYRKIIKDLCIDCINILDGRQSSHINLNRNQLGVVLDYFIIWYQLLGLHLEGVGVADVVGIAKIQVIVKEQPKKLTPGHIQLLKIKFNALLNANIAQQQQQQQLIPISSGQKITAIISKQSNNQRIPAPIQQQPPLQQQPPQQTFHPQPQTQTQNQQILTKLMSNFGPIQQQGMMPISQVKNGFVPAQNVNNGLYAPNLQYNPVINQIPVNQSVMMHK